MPSFTLQSFIFTFSELYEQLKRTVEIGIDFQLLLKSKPFVLWKTKEVLEGTLSVIVLCFCFW
jgi:hypothetical protein